MQKLSQWILRYASLITFLAVILSAAGAYYSVLLYKNLRTEFQELLPTSSRSVIDLDRVTQRLDSIDNLAVLVFSNSPEDSKRFVTDLARRLEEAPPSVIASVEYRIDQELRFFKKRQALYMDIPDLIRIRDYVQSRIDYEKELYNPLNIFRESELPEPRLNFLALKQKYESRATSYSRLPDGFYATPDEKVRAVIVNMPGASLGMRTAKLLKRTVVKAIDDLNPRSYAPDLEIRFTGSIQNSLEEQSALVDDLELSTVIVTLMVSAALFLYFRSSRAVFALMTSLFMGTFWTFGVSYFLVGYLNANSAFLGSIVIGNGINFGIIFLARYLEEKRTGVEHQRAIYQSMVHTSVSTWTAALAAGLSYGSLMLTSFRGFRQFGVIGFIGMVLCWISAFSVLPAMLTVFDRYKPLVSRKQKLGGILFGRGMSNLLGRYSGWILWVSLGITLASVITLPRIGKQILETDLSKLRSKQSIHSGSAYYSKYLDLIFQRYLSPVVVLADSEKNAQAIAQLLREKKEKEGKDSPIASVQTLKEFVPRDQKQKIQVLRQIWDLLPPNVLRRLSREDRQRVNEFLTPEVFHPIQESDLPPLILRRFTEKDGSVGKLVLIEPPLGSKTWEGEKLNQFVRDIRTLSDSVEPGVPVAGTLALTSDMIEAVSTDGPKATGIAFLSVVLLVIVLFRHPKTVVQILGALILGVLWLAGIMLGFNVRVNFLNFIALPITFGIGVDYGVNIFQRYRETRARGIGILEVIRHTGSAVSLCSFTTIVGYSSLLIASNQGFVSFGLLAVLGEITCLLAAILTIPALLVWTAHYFPPISTKEEDRSRPAA